MIAIARHQAEEKSVAYKAFASEYYKRHDKEPTFPSFRGYEATSIIVIVHRVGADSAII
jgi:hypothetical protein